MKLLLSITAMGIVLAACFSLTSVALCQDKTTIDFEREVAPILITRCLECHSASEKSGNLVLSANDGLVAGGDSGPVMVSGKPEESLIIERVRSGEMPPPKSGHSMRLPDSEIALLERWISQGARWPEGRTLDLYEKSSAARGGRDWWSLQPLRRPRLPRSNHIGGLGNAIDAFVQSRLDEASLLMSPPADKRVLLRRVYVDLLGLPPTAEDFEAFEEDESPDAYERLVDRLLASPQFGERWARHWLDVARYAETSGYERDQEKPYAWRYRDWVIRSFNEDYPYDRFVRDQICGDALPDRTVDTTIATGFLRLGTWNDEPNDPQEYKYDRLEDLVDATSSTFLGLTVKCARCHDHKYDPIYQADYYRVANAFWTGPIEDRDRNLLGGPSADELGFPDVLGWTDIRSDPPPLRILKKGDPHRPLDPVDSRLPSFFSLAVVNASGSVGQSPGEANSTAANRRVSLAKWICEPSNPLTARVMVNRVWQHHFGSGLVTTSSNFGFTGDQPSHPDLLDWLAHELVDSGYSLKHIHRLILLSATYRQSSLHPDAAKCESKDPENRLLWRQERRRLDAESLRDALLCTSDELELRMGGPSFRPTISADALEGLSRKSAAWTASPPAEQRRRSVYVYAQRSLLPPLLTTFDFSDTTAPCPKRDVTIAAPQALSLLNNKFVHERSQAIARRVIRQCGDDPVDQIPIAWRSILGRPPTAREHDRAIVFVADQRNRLATVATAELPDGGVKAVALASLCHVLLNTNEFIFVD